MGDNSWEKSNYVLAASADGSSLPDPLQKFYEDRTDSEVVNTSSKAPNILAGSFVLKILIKFLQRIRQR